MAIEIKNEEIKRKMYEGKPFNEKIRQIGFLLVLVFLACLIIGKLTYFASSVLGGFTLFMILRRPHRYFTKKGWGNTLTTTVLMLSTFFVLVVVVGGLITILYSNLKSLQPQVIMHGLQHIHDIIIDKWGYNIFSDEVIQKALGIIGGILPGILAASGNVLANLIMMMFVLFFMLHQRAQFEQGVEKSIPLSTENVELLKNEVHNMVISNAIGIPLIMLGQAVISGLAYWVLDAGDPIIWGIITGFFGLVPVIGTGGVWVPLAINLIAGGHIWQGIVLVIYGACVISYVDNVVRIVFLRKRANVHPLVTLFGVILGMNLFGFWGLIFGPLILSGFFLLVKIYKNEFRADSL
jgi:predicted PurR-regulated permease PerM